MIGRFLRERWALVVGPLALLTAWELLSRAGVIPVTFFRRRRRSLRVRRSSSTWKAAWAAIF
ncbi:hypothetical protein [Nesterenkonia pannonica]|uniref:hypothetical protein n=1 Tax=Nesterenkonia pannonica TaxID=1548602 RepID=UPI0021645AD8|nr:hypothetical protein [Nesterenkonia pannonica]